MNYREKNPSKLARKCGKCKIVLPNECFYKRKNRNTLDYLCKKCRCIEGKKWYDPNHNPNLKKYRKVLKARRLLKLFNLTVKDWNDIYKFQNNVCAICKRKSKRPNTDHNHISGLIRGILCPTCNRALSRFQDNVERLKTAAEYLINPPAVSVLGNRYGVRGKITKLKRKTECPTIIQ